jgi:Na+/glutamate symporter
MKKNSSKLNLTPEQKHKDQTTNEIWLPVLITLTICLALALLLVFLPQSNNEAISMWADISIILMILPMFLVALFTVVIIHKINLALQKYDRTWPAFFIKARTITDNAARLITTLTKWITTPVIKIKVAADGINSFVNTLVEKFTKNGEDR